MYKITDQQAGDLYHLMVNLGRKQVQFSDAQDVAQEALLKAMKSYDPSHGTTFEQYAVGVVHYRTLMDKIKFIYRRKNTHSIDYIYAENGTGLKDLLIDTKSDKVGKILVHAQELFDSGNIDLTQYNILVMKANRHSNKEIAKELDLSEGRVSQMWGGLKPILQEI